MIEAWADCVNVDNKNCHKQAVAQEFCAYSFNTNVSIVLI